MLFSLQFNVKREDDEVWFDPILDADTDLFIDPFLMFRNPVAPFDHAHADIIEFFNGAFNLAALSGGDTSGQRHKKLLQVLSFPEPGELCLGYSEASTSGAGSGGKFSTVIAAGILESIALGVTNVTHFEEIALFHKGIAHDRISDITANILKSNLIEYTQSISGRHGIDLTNTPVRNLRFNRESLVWEDGFADLPMNPFSGKAVLLVPAIYLRRLPTINPDDFWDFLWSNEGERLRTDFGFEVKSNVNKEKIIRVARKQQFFVRQYLTEVEGRPAAQPYDLESDPQGVYRWDPEGAAFCDRNPVDLVQASTPDELAEVIRTLVNQYRLYVEQDRGWELLWNDDRTSRSERAAQNLFRGIVKPYCRANDITFSREVDTGRGPVDFEFAAGYRARVLLEVKLARNSRFWHGLKTQLPTYLTASDLDHGYYLVIAYNDADLKRVSGVQEIVQEVAQKTQKAIQCVIVDASPKSSASTA